MSHTLAKNAVFNVMYRVLNVIFPLISASYISRVLEPEGLGKVAYAQNIVSYFVMVAALGIPSYGTREIARCKDRQTEVNKLFSELVTINVLSTVVCLAIYYVVIFAFFRDVVLLYAVFGLELMFNGINIDWFYQGREDYVYITWRSILVKTLSLIALFVFVKGPQDFAIYALIICMGTGCNYIFNVIHVRKYVKLTICGLNLKKHIYPVWVLLLSSAMASLYNKVDMTMLGWLSTDASVGFYSNAHKVVNIILTMVTAITAVFLPRLSYIYRNEQENYQQYLSLGLKVVLFLAVPSCLGLLTVADRLVIVLFGDLYVPMVSTVRILAILIIIKGVGDLLCYQAIISSGNEGKLVASRVVAGIVNIILNSILISQYAQNGAALASVISEVIVNGMLLPCSLKISKPVLNMRFVLSTIASTLTMLILAVMLSVFVEGMVWSLVAMVFMGALIYFAVASVTGNDIIMMVVVSLKDKFTKC